MFDVECSMFGVDQWTSLVAQRRVKRFSKGNDSEAVKESTFKGQVHALAIFGGEADEEWFCRALSDVFPL